MHKLKRKQYQDLNIDNKVRVMELLERNGKAKLTVIGNNTFKEVVRANVSSSAILMTDTHLSHQGLTFEFAGHSLYRQSFAWRICKRHNLHKYS